MSQDIREKALKAAVVVTVLSIFSGSVMADDWSVYDKNIAQLEAAYTGGLTTTTSVRVGTVTRDLA